MAAYQLGVSTTIVIRTADGASIPADSGNCDFQAYQAWLAAGGVPDPYVAPAAAPQSILSQDLMAQFTVADYTLIVAAIAATPAFGLLWVSLQAQGGPMIVTNARFLAGWSALVTVLGQARMTAIASALNVTVT